MARCPEQMRTALASLRAALTAACAADEEVAHGYAALPDSLTELDLAELERRVCGAARYSLARRRSPP